MGSESTLDKINHLIELLDETGEPRRKKMNMKIFEENEFYNEAIEEIEYPLEEEEDVDIPFIIPDQEQSFNTFTEASIKPIVAIDSGIIRLGETENGLFIALRGAIIIDTNNHCEAILYRTGPCFLSYEYKLKLLHKIGADLLKPDLFVKIDYSDPDNPNPYQIKDGVADDAHQYADRFRNWFERMLQLIAVERISNGIIVVDGALTLRTRDTPSTFLQFLGSKATQNGNATIAISKQSQLQVENKPIHFWLDDNPMQRGYLYLSPRLRIDRRERSLGNIYAIRFTPFGATFRMDVKAVEGQSDSEAINTFITSSFMKSGYPDILVRAHAYSYFTSGDVILFQSWIRANHEIIPKISVDLGPPFAPFGGKFK